MFSRKQYLNLLLSGVGVFFGMTFLIYMVYMGMKQDQVTKPPQQIQEVVEAKVKDQAVMAQDVPKIKAGTKVAFEIVDQFGVTTQSTSHEGIHWMDYTRPKLRSIYPDYVITQYSEDAVTLTRVIERQIEPDYILTIYNNNIVISTQRDGHKVFYKETGIGQHDLSEILTDVLERGIPITPQQKDAILEDADQVYMILQEYDE